MNITGLSTNTFEDLQVDAGAAFKNLGIKPETTGAELKALLEAARIDPEKKIGATDGGFNFLAAATVRYPTVDGLKSNIKGMAITDSIDVSLAFTSKEITPEQWALAIGNANIDKTTTPGTTVITPKFSFDIDSYVPDICFVGSMADGKRIAVVQLLNVLNTTGVNFQSNNMGEGSLVFEMHAHLEDPWDETPPYRVYYFEVANLMGALIAAEKMAAKTETESYNY